MKSGRVVNVNIKPALIQPHHPSTMADNDEAWVTNSNEALTLQLGERNLRSHADLSSS